MVKKVNEHSFADLPYLFFGDVSGNKQLILPKQSFSCNILTVILFGLCKRFFILTEDHTFIKTFLSLIKL